MNIEAIQKYCMSFPSATEGIKWENDLAFMIAEKMFAVVALHPSENGRLSFKCTPEEYAILVEREGIVPAPYMARNHWVSVTDSKALTQSECKRLLRDSYDMVRAKLPRKVQASLAAKKEEAAD
jgi:predicted DNA-binding protein (MmcQ/YjbR family)